jgi:hypothetical protein
MTPEQVADLAWMNFLIFGLGPAVLIGVVCAVVVLMVRAGGEAKWDS